MFKIKFDEAKFRADLEAEVRRVCSPAAMDAVAKEAREIIVERTRTEKVDVNGIRFEAYSTRPIYISKKFRMAPSGGIETPQTRRKQTSYYSRKGAKAAGAVTRRFVTIKQGRKGAGRGGKTMFFPGGYREYRSWSPTANLDNTGDMLNGLAILGEGSAERRRVLWFSRPTDDLKARGHNAGIPGRLPQREFFGIVRPKDIRRLVMVWEGAVRGK